MSFVNDRLAWCEANLPKFRQKPGGRAGEACCELPGHDDNRPSLFIGLESSAGHYSCQGCGGKGTLVQYAEVTGKPAFPVPEAAGGPPPTSWTYQDPGGNPLLRVTRRDLDGRKSFFQKRWEGGAWVRGGLSTQPLLYAPELAAAPAGSLCFLVEGEKCAQHLTERGLLATTAPMGAGKFDQVGRDWLELLLPLGVVILPDNDDPGKKHALQVAERLQRELDIQAKILLLPGLGPKEDVADWLLLPRTKANLLALVPTALSLEQFQQSLGGELVAVGDQPADPWAADPVAYSTSCVDQRKAEWDPPVPLDGRPEKPVFPIQALPGLAQEYALAVAEANQVPVSFAASLLLGAVSTATLKRVVLDPGRGPVCALNEYFLTSLESGSGKSSSMSNVFAPLYRWERLAVERAQVPDGQANEVGILSSDPTPEALENRLRANDGRFGVANPEAADLFAVLAGRYSAKGAGANIGLFLKGYSGDHHRSDRVLRGATLIREPRLTLTLALQPSAFEQVCSSGEFRERGLMARFLLDVPESLLGRRKLDPLPVRRDLQDRWASLLGGLLSIDPPRGEANELEPFRVPISPQANGALRDFRAWSEDSLKPDGYWSDCREFGARAAEHVLKLAGLLHCIRHSASPAEHPVSEETMQAGITIFQYYAEHVRQAAGSAAERRIEERLEYLLGRIRSKAEWKTSFKARDLLVLVKKTRGFESIDALLPDLERLCQLGYLARFEVNTKGRSSLRFHVSPWIHSSRNDPQYPQSRAKPYGKGLSPVGGVTHSNPQIPTKGSGADELAATDETFVGNDTFVGGPLPTSQSLMGKGSSEDCGLCGSFSESNPQKADLLADLNPSDFDF